MSMSTTRVLIGQKLMVYCTGKLILSRETSCYYLQLFYKSNRLHFLWVSRRHKPTRDVWITLEMIVNHSPDSPNTPRGLFRQETHRKCGHLSSKKSNNTVICWKTLCSYLEVVSPVTACLNDTVVGQFYPWFKFTFLCFGVMVMSDSNEF